MKKDALSQSKRYNKPFRRLMRGLVLQTIFWYEESNGVLLDAQVPLTVLQEKLLYIVAMNEAEDQHARAVDMAFVLSLLAGVLTRVEELKTMISSHIKTFDLPKVAPIDRACLYIGIFELKFSDLPPKVAINEAIEVAKSFGAQKSSSFINGIMNAVFNDIKEESK